MTLPIIQEEGGPLNALVRGLSIGTQQAMPSIQEMIMNRAKQQQMIKAFPNLFGTTNENPPDKNLMGNLSISSQESSPSSAQSISNQPISKPKYTHEDALKAAMLGNQPLEHAISEAAKSEEKKVLEEKKVFTPSVEKYFTRIEETRDEIPQIKSSLEAEEASIMSGAVDPWSSGHMANMARYMGLDMLAPTLETPGSKGFKTAQKTFLTTSLQNAFKGATTAKQINLVEQLLAEPGASREANLASLWLMQSNMMVDEMKLQIVDSLKSQGVSGYNIPALASRQLEPYRKQLSEQYTEALKELIKRAKIEQ